MVMSFQRFAGDVWNAILKNPFTDAYQHAVDNMLIAPAERMAVPVGELREGMYGLAEAYARKFHQTSNEDALHNGLTAPQAELIERLYGKPLTAAANESYRSNISDSGFTPSQSFASLLDVAIERGNPSHDVLRDVASRMVAGNVGFTDVGNTMRQFLIGSPGAAYAAGAAGLGLGAWGAHDIYQALQQQAEDNAAAAAEAEQKKASQRHLAKGGQTDQSRQS